MFIHTLRLWFLEILGLLKPLSKLPFIGGSPVKTKTESHINEEASPAVSQTILSSAIPKDTRGFTICPSSCILLLCWDVFPCNQIALITSSQDHLLVSFTLKCFLSFFSCCQLFEFHSSIFCMNLHVCFLFWNRCDMIMLLFVVAFEARIDRLWKCFADEPNTLTRPGVVSEIIQNHQTW